ncbi:hypothetical protein BDW66DRAFT_146196 [Aspergillus desertorum]
MYGDGQLLFEPGDLLEILLELVATDGALRGKGPGDSGLLGNAVHQPSSTSHRPGGTLVLQETAASGTLCRIVKQRIPGDGRPFVSIRFK